MFTKLVPTAFCNFLAQHKPICKSGKMSENSLKVADLSISRLVTNENLSLYKEINSYQNYLVGLEPCIISSADVQNTSSSFVTQSQENLQQKLLHEACLGKNI